MSNENKSAPSSSKVAEAVTIDRQFMKLKCDVLNKISFLEAALRTEQDKRNQLEKSNQKLKDDIELMTKSNEATLSENLKLKNEMKQSQEQTIRLTIENNILKNEKATFNNRLKLFLNEMVVPDNDSDKTMENVSHTQINNKRANDMSLVDLADEQNPYRKHKKTIDSLVVSYDPRKELTNSKNLTIQRIVQLQSISDAPITTAHNGAVKENDPLALTEIVENPIQVNRNSRRNIKKVMAFDKLAPETKKAYQQEKERKKQYTRRLQKYSETYGALPGELTTLDKLVLDFDFDSKRELLAVDKRLVTKMKPHQCAGVKFMWDACFESIEKLKCSNGSGCILGHCMGLGKTLQVITLVHTLLTHSAKTKVSKVLVICPVNVILNWVDEFEIWLKDFRNKSNINIYEFSSCNFRERTKRIKAWHTNGGVLLIGYHLFLLSASNATKDDMFHQAFINPGADLIVCDEGHLLKNPTSKLSLAINKVRTLRRIILTGSPLQNNLKEYFTMIEFVKPRLLGTEKEFNNGFVGPITNGQFIDSTEEDITLMKYRAYILHKLLEGCFQRRDYSVLAEFLPPKQEYVLFIRLTKVQIDLYKFFIGTCDRECPVAHLSQLKRVFNHPNALVDFAMRRKTVQPITRKVISETSVDSNSSDCEPNDNLDKNAEEWWKPMFAWSDQLTLSGKMLLLFSILCECEARGEKLLVFSGCLSTLNVIEHFLATNNTKKIWTRNWDYLRMDGSTTVDQRKRDIQLFNDESNKRARLFLISTKAGCLGVNLTAANRVIIFDASWNPSNDIQSIFRTYRIGQNKECYVYRFIAYGTMEEKIYDRQVSKLSMAKRVIDEQQIGRYYKEIDLQQLYGVDDLDPTVKHTASSVTNDNLLNSLLKTHGDVIFKYHDHDSLLVDLKDETLTDQEIGDVWDDFETTGIEDFEE